MNQKIEGIWDKTKAIVIDNDRIRELLTHAADKIKSFTESKESKGKLVDSVKLVMRMIRSQLAGEASFSNRTLFLLIFSIVYFVMPADLIPDFVPMLGFTDDITVLYFVTESLSDDIEHYKSLQHKDDSL
jgi:uncharacterized membrane protein YkvA (DUF1232 family)